MSTCNTDDAVIVEAPHNCVEFAEISSCLASTLINRIGAAMLMVEMPQAFRTDLGFLLQWLQKEVNPQLTLDRIADCGIDSDVDALVENGAIFRSQLDWLWLEEFEQGDQSE